MEEQDISTIISSMQNITMDESGYGQNAKEEEHPSKEETEKDKEEKEEDSIDASVTDVSSIDHVHPVIVLGHRSSSDNISQIAGLYDYPIEIITVPWTTVAVPPFACDLKITRIPQVQLSKADGIINRVIALRNRTRPVPRKFRSCWNENGQIKTSIRLYWHQVKDSDALIVLGTRKDKHKNPGLGWAMELFAYKHRYNVRAGNKLNMWQYVDGKWYHAYSSNKLKRMDRGPRLDDFGRVTILTAKHWSSSQREVRRQAMEKGNEGGTEQSGNNPPKAAALEEIIKGSLYKMWGTEILKLFTQD